MKIQESAENYIETIYIMSKKKQSIKAIDIAKELDYSKASVSVAMKNLREQGYIVVDEAGYISLTPTGIAIGEGLYERHVVISQWLRLLGVPEEKAASDACKMEHVLSKDSWQAIKRFVESHFTEK